MIARFVYNNFNYVVQNPRKAYATVKAMRLYAKAHPDCEITGLRPIQVHHKKPIHRFPELAADPSNFKSIYDKLHIAFGHGSNFQWYVENIDDIPKLKIVKD